MCKECYDYRGNFDSEYYLTNHPVKTALVTVAVIGGAIALYDYFKTDSETTDDIDKQRSETTSGLAKKCGNFLYTMTWPVSKWLVKDLTNLSNQKKCEGCKKCEC